MLELEKHSGSCLSGVMVVVASPGEWDWKVWRIVKDTAKNVIEIKAAKRPLPERDLPPSFR